MPKCRVDGCDGEADRKGLCTAHYMRARRHNGDPEAGRLARGYPARFVMEQALPFKGSECLLWPYYVNERTGYAQATLDGKLRLVHRYVCEVTHGAPPSPGLHASHSCGVRRCVNPAHLSWKTPLENAADKVAHGTNLSGIRNPNAKLTDEEVVAIRVLRGRMPASEIARIFGITSGAVYTIQLRRSRRNL